MENENLRKIELALRLIMDNDHLSAHKAGLAQRSKNRKEAEGLLREVLGITEEQASVIYQEKGVPEF